MVLEYVFKDTPKLCQNREHQIHSLANGTLAKPSGCIYLCPDNGPDRWHAYFPNAAGNMQSPINIQSSLAEYDRSLAMTPFEFHYCKEDFVKLSNTGSSWKLMVKENSRSKLLAHFLPDKEYKVVELHSHWGSDTDNGSEHLVDGKAYAMEIHIVHYNTKYGSFESALNNPDGLLVLAVLCAEGEHNKALEPVVSRLTDIAFKGDYVNFSGFDVLSLLPRNRTKFYTYSGSLTAPPCNECVLWIVLSDNVFISKNQVAKFTRLHSVSAEEAVNNPVKLEHNIRPAQPLNNRCVRRSFP